MNDPPKRKRRRYQFSLRTLMIAITLFALIPCGYVGWQVKIVRGRDAMWPRFIDQDHAQFETDVDADGTTVKQRLPWIRRLLGDESIDRILIPKQLTVEERRLIHEYFPEATIIEAQ